MKLRTLCYGLAAAALLGACRGGDDAPGAPTVTALATGEIVSHSNETATPLEFNATSLSSADTDDTSPPVTVN